MAYGKIYYQLITSDGALVTPHDTNELAKHGTIYCGEDGNVKIKTVDGNDLTFTGLKAGTVLPVAARQVYATGTTSGSVIVMY